MAGPRHELIRAAADAAESLATNGGAWNVAARTQALALLESLGLPGAQDESWRFTPLKALDRPQWVPAPRPAADASPIDHSIAGFEAIRIVLVDGYLDEEQSDLDRLPPGLELLRGGLEVAFEAEELDRERAFEALNLAAAADPFVLRVNRSVEAPVHLIHYSSAGETARLASPRLRVEVLGSAELSLVEDHRSAADSEDLVNLGLDLEVAANGQVRWTRLVRTGDRHRHLARMRVRQARDSVVQIQAMTLSGGLVRHDVEVILDGANAECALHGLVVGEGEMIADNHSVIRHRAPHARSTEHFRNVLDGRSRAVFAGRVVVEEGVTASQAFQNNANLLLSDEARVDALPQLEIYNDDVKASHGATLGQLDKDAMFYLRSRGVGQDTARAILTWAFANVVVEEIALEPIRALVRRAVFEHLPGAGVDESVIGGLA